MVPEILFEDRSTYDAAVDPVAVVTLRVECHPKQVAALTAHFSATTKQAGVYCVEIGGDEMQKLEERVAAIEERLLESIDSMMELSGRVAAIEEKGKSDAKPAIQHPDQKSETTGDGPGSDAASGGTATRQPADEDGGVAGAAGQDGAESVGGSGDGKDLRDGAGNSRRKR